MDQDDLASPDESDEKDFTKLLDALHHCSCEECPPVKEQLHQSLSQSKDTALLKILVHCYLKLNSKRALDVLVGVREPHDRNLFDILVDYLHALPQYRLSQLILISQIVHKKPAWLPVVIKNHRIINSVLTIIKTDQDVLTLVHSIWVFVELISTLPSIVATCLPDIFECFCRLCQLLYIQKRFNQQSDLSTLNLHVWVYRLFHKLYGMYPCNFLAHLRQFYSKTEREASSDNSNVAVFDTIIIPFLHTVRLHPLLVTAAKDTEISNNRWKKMEAHDIIVECSKLVLDPLEGVQEQCDLYDDWPEDLHATCSCSSCGTTSTVTKCSAPETIEFVKYKFNQATSESLIGQTNQHLMSSIVSIDSSMQSYEHIQDLNFLTPKNEALSNINSATTTPIVLPDFDIAQEATSFVTTETANKSNSNSSPNYHPCYSSEFENIGVYFPTSETTFKPIDSTQPIDEEDDKEVCEINENAVQNQANKSNHLQVSGRDSIGGPMTPFVTTTRFLTGNAPTVRLEIIDNKSEAELGNDKIKAEEFKSAFRQANNRLRYQSQCVPDDQKSTIYTEFYTINRLKRSESCPNLRNQVHDEITSYDLTSYDESNRNQSLNECSKKEVLFEKKRNVSDLSGSNSSLSQTNLKHRVDQCLGYINEERNLSQIPICKILHLQQHMKALRMNETEKNERNLSPVALLDKQLKLGSELCLREINLSIMNYKDTDWAHFGEPPQSDEMKIESLKNQIQLLHTQLLFERQQRESYATRNRHLLKKAKKNKAREEEFSAQRDLLHQQENEIKNYKEEVRVWRERYFKIEEKMRQESEKHKMLVQEVQEKCKKIENEKRELEDDFETIKQKTTQLQFGYQTIESINSQLKEEASSAEKKIGKMRDMKNENENLKRQVLLLSQLYNNAKDQLICMKKNLVGDEIHELETKTLRHEIKDFKSRYELTKSQLDNFRTRCFEMEDLFQKKEAKYQELKRINETKNTTHKEQLSIEKERVRTLLRTCSRLEQHILTLYGQLGMKEHEQRLRDLKPSTSRVDPSDSDSEPSNPSNSPSNAERAMFESTRATNNGNENSDELNHYGAGNYLSNGNRSELS